MNTENPFLSLNADSRLWYRRVIFETFLDNEIEQLDEHDSLLLMRHSSTASRTRHTGGELAGYRQKRHDKGRV